MQLAPIALFVYRRPVHTQECLRRLAANEYAKESEIWIFSDGPKNQQAESGVMEVRNLLNGISGFKKVCIVERKTNFGLAKSIISGVTEMVERFGKVIVLEDDLVTSQFFLRYMNEGLDLYKDCDKVASIHGYVYPLKSTLPETFFLRGADCWGWATWRRAWKGFNPDGAALLERLKNPKERKLFDRDSSFPFYKMLKDQVAGRNDSWAIRWHASAFLNEKLTLYPGRSLVHNIGMDNLATHCQDTDAYDVELSKDPIKVTPIHLAESLDVNQHLKSYFQSLHPSFLKRLKSKIGILFSLSILR